jgi:hypothetical protein
LLFPNIIWLGVIVLLFLSHGALAQSQEFLVARKKRHWRLDLKNVRWAFQYACQQSSEPRFGRESDRTLLLRRGWRSSSSEWP